MERKLWNALYPFVMNSVKAISTRHVRFPHEVIVMVFFWAQLHDRPIHWAVQAENWPQDLRPTRLPSASTMSRRVKRPAMTQALQQLSDQLRAVQSLATYLACVDAKPLQVGGFSKDPDARWGYATRSKAKGYKLIAIVSGGVMPLAWDLFPMNISEAKAAEKLLTQVALPGGYLLADSAYDINHFYTRCEAHGVQLVAPRKRPQAGLGHRPHAASRLRAIELLGTRFGQDLYRARSDIEQKFGQLTNHATGLKPLPNWVRRHARVHRYVHSKLILNALRTLIA